MNEVIDFHSHAFPDELAPRAVGKLREALPHPPAGDGTVGGLLASMERAGIRRSVICSIATASKQGPAILDWSLRVRSESIEPFASVHPGAEDPAAEVRRVAESGLLGLKLHPQYQDAPADDEAMRPIYREAEACGLIVVLHAGLDYAFPPEDERSHPARILEVHRAFPRLALVATHMGGWKRWAEARDLLAGTGVYLETSFTVGLVREEVFRGILERHDPARIVFGTDSPWLDQAEELERVRRALGGPELCRQVMRGNAERLLAEARDRVRAPG
jgi:hypothetical protein